VYDHAPKRGRSETEPCGHVRCSVQKSSVEAKSYVWALPRGEWSLYLAAYRTMLIRDYVQCSQTPRSVHFCAALERSTHLTVLMQGIAHPLLATKRNGVSWPACASHQWKIPGDLDLRIGSKIGAQTDLPEPSVLPHRSTIEIRYNGRRSSSLSQGLATDCAQFLRDPERLSLQLQSWSLNKEPRCQRESKGKPHNSCDTTNG